jgi:hypothetical protein
VSGLRRRAVGIELGEGDVVLCNRRPNTRLGIWMQGLAACHVIMPDIYINIRNYANVYLLAGGSCASRLMI